jgi:hypothetical protein
VTQRHSAKSGVTKPPQNTNKIKPIIKRFKPTCIATADTSSVCTRPSAIALPVQAFHTLAAAKAVVSNSGSNNFRNRKTFIIP